jgi:hypothetical protein
MSVVTPLQVASEMLVDTGVPAPDAFSCTTSTGKAAPETP